MTLEIKKNDIGNLKKKYIRNKRTHSENRRKNDTGILKK